MGGVKAKMGMTEDFEASLQVLRGFDTDISIEVNEIKVSNPSFWPKEEENNGTWLIYTIKVLFYIYIYEIYTF